MEFRALTDLYLSDGRVIQAGQTFTAPAGWVPASNVDPLTPDAVQAFWNAGPAGCMDAEWRRCLFTNGQRWSDVPVAAPATQWLPADPTKPWLGFKLGGTLGGNLGVHPVV
jgi:hypothetical protein